MPRDLLDSGGVAGAWWAAPERVTGVLLASASGTLVAALAFELFPEAVETGGLAPAAVGLVNAAVTFVLINTIVDSESPPVLAMPARSQ